MTEIEITRNNHLIDPSLHIWGWEIPAYLFLGGMAAGLMIVSALIARRTKSHSAAMAWMPFAAPLVLSAGMGALFLDLEYKLHVFRFYTAFRPTSPMSWGSWILLAVYPATLLLGLARIFEAGVAIPQFARGLAAWSSARMRQLEQANVVLGIALGAYTGILLGTLGARAAWNSALLGPLFLVSGLSTGAALVMLLPISHEEHEVIRRWDIAAVGVELALLALYFVQLVSSGERGRQAADLFFGGPFTAVFWSLVVIGGLLVPLSLELIESRRGLRPTFAAPVLLLCGGLALRWAIVAAGQAM